MNKNQELFEKAPVSKAVAVMAIPTMISMLVVVIYNMADTFYWSDQRPYESGSSRFFSDNPIFMVFMALGNLFGIGGSSAIFPGRWENTNQRKRSIFPHSAVYGSPGRWYFMAVVSILGMELILKLSGTK